MWSLTGIVGLGVSDPEGLPWFLAVAFDWVPKCDSGGPGLSDFLAIWVQCSRQVLSGA
jgi:hypothetical protein